MLDSFINTYKQEVAAMGQKKNSYALKEVTGVFLNNSRASKPLKGNFEAEKT